MPSSKPPQRLADIIANIRWIQEDIKGLSEADFLASRLVQDAVMYRLLRISEAAKKLGSLAEELAPQSPWAQIRSFGNVIRHEYDVISLPQIWVIATRDLAALLQDCQAAAAHVSDAERGSDNGETEG